MPPKEIGAKKKHKQKTARKSAAATAQAASNAESYSIIILGRGGVGKTCIVVRLVHGMFLPGYEPSRLTRYEYGLPYCNLIIYDTAGEEVDLTEMDEELYRKTDGAVLVVAVEYELSTLIPLLEAYRRVKESDDIPVVLIISKCDLPKEKWKFTLEDIEQFKKDNNIKEHIQTSAKENGNVIEPFVQIIDQIKQNKQNLQTSQQSELSAMPETKPAKRVKKKWFCI